MPASPIPPSPEPSASPDSDPKGRPARFTTAYPGVRRTLAVLAILLAFAGCGDGAPEAETETARVEREDSPRHLLLLTIDTWRGDHFAASRAGERLTPELARFAREGLRFDNAVSVGNATSPGVTGILTGWFPFRSGLIENRSIIPPAVTTLGTRLRDAGFTTAAFVANPVIGPGFGFEQGFGRYSLLPRDGHKVPGRRITDAGLEWLEGRAGGSPFFLWLHYMEPHGPYTPPPEMRELFPVEAFDAATDIPLKPHGDNRGDGAIPFYQQLYRQGPASRDGRDYEARYAAEVREVDRQVAQVLAWLEESGLASDTLVILTSDHGEALAGDHGFYFSHANGLTRDQVHVPLVLKAPGVSPGVEEKLVSTADVVPTVLELLGLPADPELDGTSLLSPEPRPAISQSGNRLALRSGDWKLEFRGQTRQWTLFDLAADPGETTNLVESHPERFAELRELLARARRRPPIAPPEIRGDPEAAERRQELKALGYL